MILMYCNKCADIVRLHPDGELRCCRCRATNGRNVNSTALEVSKHGILIEMADDQLTHALVQYDEQATLPPIHSYLIPRSDYRFPQ